MSSIKINDMIFYYTQDEARADSHIYDYLSLPKVTTPIPDQNSVPGRAISIDHSIHNGTIDARHNEENLDDWSYSVNFKLSDLDKSTITLLSLYKDTDNTIAMLTLSPSFDDFVITSDIWLVSPVYVSDLGLTTGWHNVTCTFVKSTKVFKIYLNGTLVHDEAFTENPGAYTTDKVFRVFGTLSPEGIDEIGVGNITLWSTALTSTDVAQIKGKGYETRFGGVVSKEPYIYAPQDTERDMEESIYAVKSTPAASLITVIEDQNGIEGRAVSVSNTTSSNGQFYYEHDFVGTFTSWSIGVNVNCRRGSVTIFRIGDGEAPQNLIDLSYNDDLKRLALSSQTYNSSDFIYFNLKGWHSVYIVVDSVSEELYLYIDGVIIYKRSIDIVPVSWADNRLRIFSNLSLNNTVFLGNVYGWLSALSSKDVRTLKNSGYELIYNIKDIVSYVKDINNVEEVLNGRFRVFINDGADLPENYDELVDGINNEEYIYFGHSDNNIGSIDVRSIYKSPHWGNICTGYELTGALTVMQYNTIDMASGLRNKKVDLLIMPFNYKDNKRFIIVKNVDVMFNYSLMLNMGGGVNLDFIGYSNDLIDLIDFK